MRIKRRPLSRCHSYFSFTSGYFGDSFPHTMYNQFDTIHNRLLTPVSILDIFRQYSNIKSIHTFMSLGISTYKYKYFTESYRC